MRFLSILLLTILLCINPCYSQYIKATKSDSSFQEVAHIDQLQQISVSEVPVTTYTPKNLKSQQQLRFQGRNTSNNSITQNTKPQLRVYEKLEVPNSIVIGDYTYVFKEQFKSDKNMLTYRCQKYNCRVPINITKQN